MNAASLALIDAGIPLKDYVTACTAGYINDRVLVDVNSHESSIGNGSELTMAMMPKSGEIVLLEMAQRFHVDHLEKVMDAAMEGCKDIHTILDKVVQTHVKKVVSSFDTNL